MALLAFDFDLQPLSLVFGSEVLEGTAGDAYIVPFDGFICGEMRRITAVLQRTVVYEVPELKDKFIVRFSAVMVDPSVVVLHPLRKSARNGSQYGKRKEPDFRFCDHCQKEYIAFKNNQAFCGITCRLAAARLRTLNLPNMKNCEWCHVEFRPVSRQPNQKFCIPGHYRMAANLRRRTADQMLRSSLLSAATK